MVFRKDESCNLRGDFLCKGHLYLTSTFKVTRHIVNRLSTTPECAYFARKPKDLPCLPFQICHFDGVISVFSFSFASTLECPSLKPSSKDC
jgi:hypothetical protein